MQLKIKDLQLLFDSLNNEIKINDQKLKYMKHTIQIIIYQNGENIK